VVADHARQRQHPPAVLDPAERATAGVLGCRAVEAREVTAEVTGAPPVVARGVAEVHADPLLGWSREPERGEPVRGSGPATGRVDHEVGGHGLLRAAVGTAEQAGAGHAPACGDETGDIGGRREGHPVQRGDATPDVVLEQRAAGADDEQPTRAGAQSVAIEVHPRVAEHVTGRCPAGAQRRGQPREELLEHVLAARQQCVDVARLSHTPPGGRFLRDGVAVDDRDGRERLGQDARGQQPRDATAEHQRVVVVVGVHTGSSRREEHGATGCSVSRSFGAQCCSPHDARGGRLGRRRGSPVQPAEP
jgi:hypothetical protein